MPTLPESNCILEGNELDVSFMLKVPIDIEVELGMSPTNPQNEQNLVTQTENLKSAAVMSKVSQVEFEEQIRILSNQIVTELFQQGEAVSTFPETEVSDNLGNIESTSTSDSSTGDNLILEEDNVVTEIPEKQKRRFIDSLNDGLTLAVNAVGKALFLGKLANYSWE